MNIKRMIRLCLPLLMLLMTFGQAHADPLVGIGGMCLDIKGGAANGNPVIIWPCNGGLNQDWYMYDNPGTINSAEGYCLTAQGKDKRSPVVARYCNNQKNQQWRLRPDNTIRTLDGLCLDAQGGKAMKGAAAILWPCKTSDNANQKWRFR